MLRQPHPDYIVKPMPEVIPAFEIAPLERARTDRAANDHRMRQEAEFAEDGDSRFNLPMLLVAVVSFVALAFAAVAALYTAYRGVVAAYAFVAANPAPVGCILAGLLAVVLGGLIIYRVRAERAARADAHAETIFGELA